MKLGQQNIQAEAAVLGTMLQKEINLLEPLTSTSWDGDAYSTTAKTKIDLSAVFSVPAGVRKVKVAVSINDIGSNGTDCWLLLAPNDTAGQGIGVTCHAVNDRVTRACLDVPCDANGDIYYQINASGASTMDIWLDIWGYWL